MLSYWYCGCLYVRLLVEGNEENILCSRIMTHKGGRDEFNVSQSLPLHVVSNFCAVEGFDDLALQCLTRWGPHRIGEATRAR